jgi:hypothetical protein
VGDATLVMVVYLPWLLLDRGAMCRPFRGFNRVGLLLSLCSLNLSVAEHNLCVELWSAARG